MEQQTKHNKMRKNGKTTNWIIGTLTYCLIGTFFSCTTDGDYLYSDGTYTKIAVTLVYADTTYTFMYAGDTIGSIEENGSGFVNAYIPLRDTVGELSVYRGSSLELDTVIHLTSVQSISAYTYTFLQLPGEKIKFYNVDGGDADAPTDSTCTKLRFLYDSEYNTADSLRFIWLSSTKASLSLPGATSESFDTLMVYKDKLSNYVEFDTDKYADSGNSTYFYYIRQTWSGAAWTGSTKVKSGVTLYYQLATYRLGTSGWTFLFGTTW